MLTVQLESIPLLAAAYAVSIYVFMIVLANLLLKFTNINTSLTKTSNRYGSIDGLRGLLASGVFIHHSFTAYVYFTTGNWDWSSSTILNQLGQATVALFFMITGFLFTIKASKPKIEWKSLYISRVARLAPLYWLIVFIVLIIVFYISNGVIKVSYFNLLKQLLQWLSFVCFGRPDLNGFPMTWTIIAGVNWSLKYEVLFYIFCVPIIHLSSRCISTRASLILSIVALGLLLYSHDVLHWAGKDSLYGAHFLGGILAAHVFESTKLRSAIGGTTFKFFSIIALFVLLSMTQSENTVGVMASITIFFSIVGGASIFGLLKTKAAIWLGDISYGIYLMHGVLIWMLMTLIGSKALNNFNLFNFWLLILTISTAVTLLASFSYHKLERPIMVFCTSKKC